MHARKARAAAAAAGVVALGLLGACGDKPTEAAQPTSIRDALGMDENSFQEREAKVQEEVRKCMAAEGFDYIPMDPSRMNVRMVGPGMEDDAEFRRTKGYGITTMFGERAEEAPDDDGNDDPNRAIREALSDEDKEAYDKALFGRTATADGEGGSFSVRVSPGGGVVAGDGEGESLDLSDAGCFGKAQEAVGSEDRLRRIGPKLQELQERIASDPRMVKADAEWAECMSDAGYDFESPEKIPEYLFGKMNELQKELGGGGGGVTASAGPDGPMPFDMEAIANSPELAALQREELALAKADDGCAESTGRADIAKKVRAEAEKRFLEENPDLGKDS